MESFISNAAVIISVLFAMKVSSRFALGYVITVAKSAHKESLRKLKLPTNR